MTVVRPEQDRDIESIRWVNQGAFETTAEAELVDRLRDRGKLLISLIAEWEGRAVGAIAFSRVILLSHPGLPGAGLGPVAVDPAFQRKGFGSLLVRAGLEKCRSIGCDFAVVLGHPEYYPRFGFISAGRFGCIAPGRFPTGFSWLSNSARERWPESPDWSCMNRNLTMSNIPVSCPRD